VLLKRLAAGAVALTALTAAAACGGSSGGSASAGGNLPVKSTVTVGVLTDLTGPAAVTGSTTVNGIKAGVQVAAQEGYTIKYVVADTTSTPTGALTAAQKLVQQDHVFAVLMISQLAFGAAPYLTSKGVPVIGANVDGPEWLTSKNMFSVYGYGDYSNVNPAYGQIFKKIGGTVFGGIGYARTPSSSAIVAGTSAAARQAGLKIGFLDTNLPFGTTDLGPTALHMKQAGVDALYTGVTQATSLALVAALRQQDLDVKALLPTGYGSDLTSGGPGASQAAQGVYFATVYEPVELQTAATKKFAAALRSAAGISEPSLHEYLGYLSVDAVVAGLKAAGPKSSPAHFIDTMLTIKNYGAQGLFGDHTISFAMADRAKTAGADNCLWITRYSGTAFSPVAGLTPACG
jgi:branched-chain amino acid transport system substrate-binding protein